MTLDARAFLTDTSSGTPMHHQIAAVQNFHEARQQAALQEVLARLTGKSNRLLSYDDVAKRLKLAGRSERGLQEIPLAAIVGSVGRYSDFTRTFLPRHDSDQERWARVKAAFAGQDRVKLPPIDVYKVGGVYFVLDGNHRVSVARREGLTHIEAHVIEVASKVPLGPDLQPDDLILKAEYADFLEQTGLGEAGGLFDLSLTVPGGYATLRAQIELYRDTLSQGSAPSPTPSEAARAWYADVYQPAVLAMRERGLLRWLPGRTEADLYLWVSEHRQALEKELGWAVRPEAAATDLLVRQSPRAETQEAGVGAWRKARLAERYIDRLLADILVPLSGGPDCWTALDQALLIAKREGARLLGLHVTGAQRIGESATTVQTRFKSACEAAGVPGQLVLEPGNIVRKICERALLTDLVVVAANHPPAAGLTSLSSGLRTLIWNCARPILAVPGSATLFERALLTYDGSPKSKEALFVAAYLAEKWKTTLTVATLLDGKRVGPSVMDYARQYLDWHEVKADYVLTEGTVADFLALAEDRKVELILMGGYSVSAMQEVVGGGSAVNFMLRDSRCPLLICR